MDNNRPLSSYDPMRIRASEMHSNDIAGVQPHELLRKELPGVEELTIPVDTHRVQNAPNNQYEHALYKFFSADIDQRRAAHAILALCHSQKEKGDPSLNGLVGRADAAVVEKLVQAASLRSQSMAVLTCISEMGSRTLSEQDRALLYEMRRDMEAHISSFLRSLHEEPRSQPSSYNE